MKRVPCALAALALAWLSSPDGANAGSQLFKCVDGGRTVYQQQACAVTAEAEPVGANRVAVKAKADAAAAPLPAPPKLKPASPSASGAPATPR